MYSLYVHVPFCERKCGYCSFYSVTDGNIDSYLDALEAEARSYSRLPLRTLYIGGGTPSVLSLTHWNKLMNIIRANFDLSHLTEATTEANPNSLSPEHIAFWRANHISRVSLGVQSLNDSELITLGRLHDSRTALRAMELVNESGLSLSCDLIFAIPGQTLRTWNDSLRRVMKHASHVSTYQLTLEPETPLYREFGDSDLNASGYMFYRYAQYMLPRHGFTQYEISSFARENHECRHNIAYWTHGNVIALGPSAVGYLDGVRLTNPRTLREYIAGTERLREELSPHERDIELAILMLRTRWGIERKNLLPEVERVIESLPEDLFVRTSERVTLSRRGMRLGNAIWSELIDL